MGLTCPGPEHSSPGGLGHTEPWVFLGLGPKLWVTEGRARMVGAGLPGKWHCPLWFPGYLGEKMTVSTGQKTPACLRTSPDLRVLQVWTRGTGRRRCSSSRGGCVGEAGAE